MSQVSVTKHTSAPISFNVLLKDASFGFIDLALIKVIVKIFLFLFFFIKELSESDERTDTEESFKLD